MYNYENGKKGRNVGFAKIDLKNRSACLHLNVQGKMKDYLQKLYLVTEPEADGSGKVVYGIPLGEPGMGQTDRIWTFSPENIGESPYHIQQICGIAAVFSTGAYAASCWTEDPPGELLTGSFTVWEPEKPVQEKSAQEKPVQEKPAQEKMTQEKPAQEKLTQEKPAQERLTQEKPAQEKWEPEEPEQEKIQKNESKPRYTCCKIDIAEIQKLPQRNRYLINNSFLLHGFFNYKYLVFLERKSDPQSTNRAERYLGVPGIYDPAEGAMALLFGFSKFVSGKEMETTEGEDSPENFGYWCCPI